MVLARMCGTVYLLLKLYYFHFKSAKSVKELPMTAQLVLPPVPFWRQAVHEGIAELTERRRKKG